MKIPLKKTENDIVGLLTLHSIRIIVTAIKSKDSSVHLQI